MPVSFKSETTLPMLMLLLIIGVILGADTYFPNDPIVKYVAAGFSIFFIIAMMSFLPWEASRLGNEFTHMLHTTRVWSSGYPVTRDLFIENVDQKQMSLGLSTLAGLRWFIYLVKTEKVDMTDELAELEYGKVEWHLFFLPYEWEETFLFRRRLFGAYKLGQIFNHGHSEVATSYLVPFEYEPPGVKIPMYFFVEATGIFKRNTMDWRHMIDQLSALDVQEDIEREKPNIERLANLGKKVPKEVKPITVTSN